MAGEIHINGSPVATAKLLDEEKRIEEERRARISRVTLEIEDILLREDFTMGELAEVLDLFNSRAHAVFSRTKIRTVKETYDRPNQ